MPASIETHCVTEFVSAQMCSILEDAAKGAVMPVIVIAGTTYAHQNKDLHSSRADERHVHPCVEK